MVTAVGLRCSADTLLRRVINTPETKLSGSSHVGIDEWAWHRGHRYGTLIVNLDTHRPLVLFPDRDQRTLATWFRKYPEIQVVCKRLVRTVLIFTESSDQLSRATDRVPGLPASPGYVQ